jgi:Tfp pilus assembly protein FimT
LLVVISIMLMMMAMAAHRMRPAVESRRTREAARALNVYLGSARNWALVNRRPCGVVLAPSAGIGQAAMVLEQVEVPPPYAGDDITAAAQVQLTSAGTIQATLSAFNASLVHVGDTIQFNYQGPWYTISGAPGSGSLTATYDQTQQVVPWSSTPSAAMPYRIYRQPFSQGGPNKSVTAPVQLPAGAVIDLTGSGTDAANFRATGAADAADVSRVYIMFSASGAVDRIYSSKASLQGPIGQPIFLLIGRLDVARGLAATQNYSDPGNLWVVINPQTGLISTAPVAVAGDLVGSRQLARDAQLTRGK